jgi:hypothetical protein
MSLPPNTPQYTPAQREQIREAALQVLVAVLDMERKVANDPGNKTLFEASGDKIIRAYCGVLKGFA